DGVGVEGAHGTGHHRVLEVAALGDSGVDGDAGGVDVLGEQRGEAGPQVGGLRVGGTELEVGGDAAGQDRGRHRHVVGSHLEQLELLRVTGHLRVDGGTEAGDVRLELLGDG